MSSRVVCWFSCGAASAVATKLAIAANANAANPLPLVVARCRIVEEHDDNDRFAADCARWFGVPVVELSNEKYGASIYAVFAARKYIAGVGGAPCTSALKREVREAFQLPGDRHVFGYVSDEQGRVDDFIDANNDISLWPILIDRGLTHDDCLAMIRRAGIRLPVMYELGYRNNNCVGCVKGGAGYWNKIRVDFPPQFERMAAFSRKMGVRLVKRGDGDRTRLFLDELPVGVGDYPNEPAPQCGIFCELAEKELTQ